MSDRKTREQIAEELFKEFEAKKLMAGKLYLGTQNDFTFMLWERLVDARFELYHGYPPAQAYDPDFGDDKLCTCTHPYYRHFDTYEDMRPVGCKYCRHQGKLIPNLEDPEPPSSTIEEALAMARDVEPHPWTAWYNRQKFETSNSEDHCLGFQFGG